MLYGNLIFIKKTGGDGSKFPVTERDITIGRSDDCLIRIYNPQVAPQHCQLIIEDNGQTTLRNLSNQTILNGKSLGQGDVTLCHGDVFKLGERLVRWEYLPTSKYYRQLLSPTGRLVAVVMPQQRSLDDQAIPGTSASEASVSKSTQLGKRRYSERGVSGSSTGKIRKSNGIDLIHKARGDLPKLFNGRLSHKASKLLLHGGKVMERKSTSGLVSSKTPKVKLGSRNRKSTMPSWKVNIVSPGQQISTGNRKSNKKATKSPKSAIKTPLKDIIESNFSGATHSNSGLKTPQKMIVDSKSSEILIKSNAKSVPKTPLKIIAESPSNKCDSSVRSRRNFSKSPSPKKSPPKSPSKIALSTPKQKLPQLRRAVHSESKLSLSGNLLKGEKRMSHILDEVYTPLENEALIKKIIDGAAKDNLKAEEIVSDTLTQTNVPDKASQIKEKSSKVRKSVKNTPAKKSLGKTPTKKSLKIFLKSPVEVKGKTPVKSSVRDKGKTPAKSPVGVKVKTPRSSVKGETPTKSSSGVKLTTQRESLVIKIPESLKQKRPSTPRVSSSREVALDSTAQSPLLIDLDYTPRPKKARYTPKSPADSPVKKTPGTPVISVGKSKSSPASRKKPIFKSEAIISSSTTPIHAVTAVSSSTSPNRIPSVNKTLERKSVSPRKSAAGSQRGVRRKLSPSSSSAERAAKMLKTSSPTKPDKNKKAALLVLGKANRKQLLSQNVKVLLKQKIVKKAIKQSTCGTSQKVGRTKKVATKTKKVLRKTASKSAKKSYKKKKLLKKNTPPKASKVSEAGAAQSPVKEKQPEGTGRGKTVVEVNQLTPLKLQSPVRISTKSKTQETPIKSPSKQNRKAEVPRSILSPKGFVSTLTGSPSGGFDKAAESYLFNSNRHSKRLSSKNDTGRPDFIELSPTALGLMPKNVAIFKTPKEAKRRSSSFVTPKSVRSTGIIKSASMSKIGNRKSVRFSSKDMSYTSEIYTPSTAEKVVFDFSSYSTPDVTVDMFVSPLTAGSITKKEFSESKFTSDMGSMSKASSTKIHRSSLDPKKCVRKLMQSPQVKKATEKDSPIQKLLPRSSGVLVPKSPSPEKTSKPSNEKSPRYEVNDIKGIRQLFATPKTQKSPKSSSSDLKGVPKLLQTPKSPKNDLTDVKGVKKLFQTPKVQKSPRNNLTDIRGLKTLLQTPKMQKSPKNDLTDVRGVKKLLRTPKEQKSPKNDLTDVRGVKKLLRTPKEQKSPKNDLTDVRGVKKLFRTPKEQKSPKNDLTDVRGVKKLLRTPKEQKSPKNDLTDVRGVKKLLRTPKEQKSPKNDLSNVAGVKRLLGSPQKSPKNELSDLRGVKKLLSSPKTQKSPKNNLLEVSGVASLFTTPVVQKISRNSTTGIETLTKSQSKETLGQNFMDLAGVKQLLISNSPESVLKKKKNVSRKPPVNDYRAIRGRRIIYATVKGPKNDLSDVTGVHELFSRHKPTSDYNINLTGVAELFDLPSAGVESKKRGRKHQKQSVSSSPQESRTKKAVTSKQTEQEKEKAVTHRGQSRKATNEETEKRTTRSTRTKKAEEKKPVKRKAVEKIKTSQGKKPSVVGKKVEKVTKKEMKTSGKKSETETKIEFSTGNKTEVGKPVEGSRKRRVAFVSVETPPSKLRKKDPVTEKSLSKFTKAAAKSVASRSKTEEVFQEKISTEGIKRVAATEKCSKTSKATAKVQSSKATSKSGIKKTPKVQNRSHSSPKTNSSESKERASPRKTRSSKSTAVSKPTLKKVSKTEPRVARSKVGRPKKSTRRK